MDFLVWVGKTRGTLWWPCYVVYSVKFWLTFFMRHSTESDSQSLRERCLLWSRYWKEKDRKIPNLFLVPCETEKWNVIRAETTKKIVKKTLLYFLANLANGKISLKRKTENDVKSWSKNWKEEKICIVNCQKKQKQREGSKQREFIFENFVKWLANAYSYYWSYCSHISFYLLSLHLWHLHKAIYKFIYWVSESQPRSFYHPS